MERRFLARGRRWVVPRAHGRVLEVGVGTAANLALYAADVRLTGIDASGPMLDQARRKVASAACWGQRLLEAVTARSADEHFTRRRLDHLSTLPLQVDTQRHTAGALEVVHARRTGP